MIILPKDDVGLLKECEVSTFRSSGKGGQHVNTTDSAVRVKHLPSGVSTTCQKTRSQHTNKQMCLDKIREIVKKLNHKPKSRRPTKKTKGSKERTLKKKKIRSDVKSSRRKPDF